MSDAQRDPLYFSSLPRSGVAVNFQVAGMQAEPR